MVLKPMPLEELKSFFDEKAVEILQFQLNKNILSQPEAIVGQEQIGMQIPKEYLEQWCVQAIGAVPIGAGSYPVDILKDNWGADIKSLACSLNKTNQLDNGDTGETSLAQKFKNAGKNLDSLFLEKKYDEIKNQWVEIVRMKNQDVISNKNLENIYYFIFLRGFKEYYLCGLKVDISRLDNIEVDLSRTTDSSVFLNNYIDKRYGYTKIYKAKKRLELRLKAKKWVEDDLCIILPISNLLEPVNLREKKLDEYFKGVLKKYKLIK